MSTPDSPIEGYVAQILNMHQIVLTAGAVDGVVKGMRFNVLDPNTREIVDPISGDTLGSLDALKKQVVVTEVRERFSVATTLSRRVNKGGQGGLGVGATLANALADIRGASLSEIYDKPRWVTEHETLERNDSGYTYEPDAEERSAVKVKDPVVQVLPDREGEADAAQEGATETTAAS